jgi:hypothetical protein
VTSVDEPVKRAVYDLYDRHHEALRSGEKQRLLDLYLPQGRFLLHGPTADITSGNPEPIVDHALAKLRRVEQLETGLDVYAVGVRGDEAVALVEEWIDDIGEGRRETRLALETLRRTGEGGWKIAGSTSEETSSSLV